MSAFSKIMTSVAGLAAVTAMAAPAAAQNYPYGGGSSGGVVGAIINSVIGGGYGQYPQGNYGYGQVSQRQLVSQCAAATEQRLNAAYRGQGYGAPNGYNGYQNGYGNQNGYGSQNGYATQGGARVVGITSVERRSNGGLKVRGLAMSSAYGSQYGGQGYGNQGYGNQGYGNQGYGGQYGGQYGNQGYQNGYGANAQADISFSCKVDAQGRINSINLQRNQMAYNRGY